MPLSSRDIWLVILMPAVSVTLIIFIPLFHTAETLASSVEKQKQTGNSTHLVFLEEIENMIYLLKSNMTLSKNMQIEFNKEVGKYTLSVLEIGSMQPLKSLANCFFHVCERADQWSAPQAFAKTTAHFRQLLPFQLRKNLTFHTCMKYYLKVKDFWLPGNV